MFENLVCLIHLGIFSAQSSVFTSFTFLCKMHLLGHKLKRATARVYPKLAVGLCRTTVSEMSVKKAMMKVCGLLSAGFNRFNDLIYGIWTNCSFKGAAVEQITLNTSETVSSTVQQDRLHPPEPVLTGSVLHGCCVYVYLYCVPGFVLFNGLVVCVGVDGADAARRLFISLLPQLSDSFVPSVQR